MKELFPVLCLSEILGKEFFRRKRTGDFLQVLFVNIMKVFTYDVTDRLGEATEYIEVLGESE